MSDLKILLDHLFRVGSERKGRPAESHPLSSGSVLGGLAAGGAVDGLQRSVSDILAPGAPGSFILQHEQFQMIGKGFHRELYRIPRLLIAAQQHERADAQHPPFGRLHPTLDGGFTDARNEIVIAFVEQLGDRAKVAVFKQPPQIQLLAVQGRDEENRQQQEGASHESKERT